MLPKDALKHIFGEDKTILVTGSKGDGKTNLGSVIQETLVELLGYKTWTNMHFFAPENIAEAIKRKKLANVSGHIYVEKPQQIHVVKSLSEVLLGIVDSVSGGKVFILDEAGIHADSSVAASKSTRTIKQLNRIIRHFECCFIILTQTKGSVPPDLREKDVDYQFKMKKYRYSYVLEIGKKSVEPNIFTGEDTITFPIVQKIKVPLSKYPVDGKFPTGFNIDINLKEALDRLSEVKDSIEMMDKGRGKEILTELIYGESSESMDSKKEAVTKEFLNGSPLTLSELSKVYGIGLKTIKRYYTEFLKTQKEVK